MADTAKRKSPAALLREKKIGACLEQISQAEEMRRLLTAEQGALVQENLVGLPVSHRQYGQGQVTSQDALTVSVDFPGGPRRFPIPNAFLEGFLSTADAAMAQRLARYRELDGQILALKQQIAAADHTIALLKK